MKKTKNNFSKGFVDLAVVGVIAIIALAASAITYKTYHSPTPPPEKVDLSRVDDAMKKVDELEARMNASDKAMDNVPIGQQSFGGSSNLPDLRALYEDSLASRITSTANSFTLVRGTDKDGNSLASSTYPFIIDEGLSTEEFVLADCTGTACTNVTRGLSVFTGTTTVSSLRFQHARGASVKITDGPILLIHNRLMQGIDAFPNTLKYNGAKTPTYGQYNIPTWDYVKDYADGLSFAGVSNADTVTKGIVEIGTAIENASSTATGSTGAILVPRSSNATSTPLRGCDGTATAGALCLVVAKNNGKINQSFIDLTENTSWSGTNTHTGLETFNATTTFATTTQNGAMFGGNIVNSFTGAETISGFSAPRAVMLSTTTNRVSMVDSDLASTSAPLLGFVINNCSNGSTCYVQTDGIVKGFSGLTAGADYYASDTAGSVSTTVGTIENYLGRAVSTSAILIDKTREWQYVSSSAFSVSSGTSTSTAPSFARYAIVAADNTSTIGQSKDFIVTKIGRTTATYSFDGTNASDDGSYSFKWSIEGIAVKEESDPNADGSITGTIYWYR